MIFGQVVTRNQSKNWVEDIRSFSSLFATFFAHFITKIKSTKLELVCSSLKIFSSLTWKQLNAIFMYQEYTT